MPAQHDIETASRNIRVADFAGQDLLGGSEHGSVLLILAPDARISA